MAKKTKNKSDDANVEKIDRDKRATTIKVSKWLALAPATALYVTANRALAVSEGDL